MILLGSVIAIPGGCDTVFAINNDMLRATPTNETNIPKRLVIRPANRNQKAVKPLLLK